MRILNELSLKEFRSKIGTNELCFSFLCDTKRGDGYECIKSNNNNNNSRGKKYLINIVHVADMMSHQQQIPCFIKLNLEYLKLFKWLMILPRVKKVQIVFG
jgi:hypothetical protein